MTEFDPKKSEFEQTDFHPKPTEEEEREARLMRILSSVEQGWKISIIRVQPSWCRGHLETVEIYDPSEAIDVDYLIRSWGGQRLHMKVHNEKGDWVGGGSISLFSYPPKVHGELLKPGDVMTQAPLTQQPTPNTAQQFAGPAPAPGIDIAQLFKLMREGKKSELDLALKILDRAPQAVAPAAPAAPAQNMGSMFEQLSTMMTMFGQMQEMFGGLNGTAAPPTNGDDLAPVIGDVVKGLLGNMNNQQPGPQQTRPALVGPRQAPPVPGPNAPPPGTPQTADHRVPDLRPVQGLGEDNLSAIAQKLTGLSPTDSVGVILQALGDMPEEKRAETMNHFMTEMMGDSGLDGNIDQDDNYLDDTENEETGPTDSQSRNTGG